MSYPETMSEIANYPKALSHAESGGGGDVSVKTLNIQNSGESSFAISNVIIDGKQGSVTINGGTNVAVEYVEPVAGIFDATLLRCNNSLQVDGEAPEGVSVQSNANGATIAIIDGAEDGATITLTGDGGNS